MPPAKPLKREAVNLEGFETLPIDPTILLDDISVRLKKLTKVMQDQHETMVQLLNTTLLNQQHLKAIKGVSGGSGGSSTGGSSTGSGIDAIIYEISKWRAAWQDEGEYKYIESTATTQDTAYVLANDFDYPLKSYQIVNDGDNTLKIGHLSTGSPIDEVITERFQSVYSGDPPLVIRYRPDLGKGIRKIVLKSDSGTSDYRLWLMW